MAKTRRVAYARLNRRAEDTLFEARPIRDEFHTLAGSKRTVAEVYGVVWYAGDFRFDTSGDFVSGIIGFSEREQFQDFDEEAWSWLKGEVHEHEGASTRTKVPFAIDLREHKRWVAFAPSYRIRAQGFTSGLQTVLNAALARRKKSPSEWEIDLVTEVTRVETWLLEHPGVVRFKRTVRYHNPVDNLDDERAEMRALAAQTKTEAFSAARNKTLRVQDNTDFVRKLDGLGTGDVDIWIEAREGSTKATFNSKNQYEWDYIDDFGEDLELGMEIMVRAVSDYGSRGDQEELL